VHVQHADGEAQFWLEPKLGLAQNHGQSARQVAAALRCSRTTKMKSALHGKIILDVEVTNVTPKGFWLILDQRELFISYDKFPWFQDATVREITSVERPSPGHLYWPGLDIDLAVESIENPERFPLISRARPKPLQRTGPPRRSPSISRGSVRRPRR
jgi:hypothetical protein